jgi:trans-aconitate 2-methyltransferase
LNQSNSYYSNGEMNVPWDPQLYLKFDRERTQPAIDLAARVELADPLRIIDLGCGPGNSTAILKARWPNAEITGLDGDAAMIVAARDSDSDITWVQDDASTWQADAEYDLVFSNAMLQWLPDHVAVLGRWFGSVSPGGALAVQIPSHLNSAVHRHILEVAADPRWSTLTAHAGHAINTAEPQAYYDSLCQQASRVDLWITKYYHVLEGPKEIINWMRGTGLRPFLSVLPTDADRAAFEAAILDRVAGSYPRRADGKVLFPFRRLFFIAYKGV